MPEEIEQSSEIVEAEIVMAETIVFEGDAVTDVEARLPAITLALGSSYPRNTHIRFNIEVRVKGVHVDETKNGLTRQHVLAYESVELVTAFDPAEAADTLGGSATSSAQQSEEDIAELGGVQFGRTSDQWGVA